MQNAVFGQLKKANDKCDTSTQPLLQTRSKTSITLLEIAAKVPYASLRVSGLTGGSLYNIRDGRV